MLLNMKKTFLVSQVVRAGPANALSLTVVRAVVGQTLTLTCRVLSL